MAAIKKAGGGKAGYLAEDVFFDDIVAAIKTVKRHLGDKQYEVNKIHVMLNHVRTLTKLQKSSDPDVAAMAEFYLGWIKKTHQSWARNVELDGFMNRYARKFDAVQVDAGDAPFTVSKDIVRSPQREVVKGELWVKKDAASNSEVARLALPDGEQYDLDFGDGIRISFRPSESNFVTQRGEFEVIFDGPPSSADLDRLMEHMDVLGIKNGPASPIDAELLYLTKQAEVSKVDQLKGYQRMLDDLDRKSASAEERVEAMLRYWNKRLKVKDVRELPSYNPLGEYQDSFLRPGSDAGHRFHYRFDISDADLEEKMGDYSLYHAITDRKGGVVGFFDQVLENSGALVSNMEKMRIGIPVRGMSPEQDMTTGGAFHAFTRIFRKDQLRTGLYFKKRLLRRQDAVSYGFDAFGRITENYRARFGAKDIAGFLRHSKSMENEANFQQGITLLDNIEKIVVLTGKQRDALLGVFNKHGVTELSDGTPIEDVIKVKYGGKR